MRRDSSRWFAMAMVASFTSAATVWAQPNPADQAAAVQARPGDQAAIEAKLDKPIRVQFLDTPLGRVAEVLQREAGVPFILEEKALGGAEAYKIKLEADQLTIRGVLNLMTRQHDLAWEITDGAVVLTTPGAVIMRSITTRVYDVRALIQPIRSFPGPTTDIDRALANTSTGGSRNGGGEYRFAASESRGSSGGALFGDSEGESETAEDQQSRLDDLIELIQMTTARAEDWEAGGGTLGSVREINGNLIVRIYPSAHEQIDRLLRQLAASQGQMVAIEGQYMVVNREQLQRALKDRGGVLGADQLAEFSKAVRPGEAGTRALGAARITCFSAQRVHVNAGKDRVFLSDLEPIANSPGAEPTLSTARNGAALDVQPTIDMDGKKITLVVRGDVVLREEMERVAVPLVGQAASTATTHAGNLTGQTDKEGKLTGTVTTINTVQAMPAGPAGFAPVMLDKPSQQGVRYRTSVTVPDGGAVVLSGVSGFAGDVSAEDSEVVLVLRAKVVR